MADTTDTVRASRLNLNSDGRPHPLLNAASLFTLIIGLLSFALGLFLRTGPSGTHGWAIAASVTGLVAMLVGLFSQMMSATREERDHPRHRHHRGLRGPGPRPGPRRLQLTSRGSHEHGLRSWA